MRLPTLSTSCHMYCFPCFRRIQCSHNFPHFTISHINAGFDLNGKSIQNWYVFTLFEIVCHLEGGQGNNCGLYITMYCYVFIFRFCWWPISLGICRFYTTNCTLPTKMRLQKLRGLGGIFSQFLFSFFSILATKYAGRFSKSWSRSFSSYSIISRNLAVLTLEVRVFCTFL